MQVSIKPLTATQKRKLRAGYKVRVKSGDGCCINLNDIQGRRCHRNFKNNKSYTVGSGVFDDITNWARNTPFVKTAINEGLKYGKNFAKEKLDEIPMFDGGLINMRRPINFKTERGTLEGTGIISDILGNINPTLGNVAKSVGLGVKRGRKKKDTTGDGLVGDLIGLYNPLYGIAAKAVGLGAQKKSTPTGEGFLGDAMGFVGKQLLNLAVDKAADYTKNKVGNYIKGSGVKRKCSEKQLAALAAGRAKRGGALYAAGGSLREAGFR